MIYVITHKEFDDSIVPSEDDTGDNISSLNPYYCELTGLYWIWKNSEESPEDLVGLVHYRRYFATKRSNLRYAYFGELPKPLEYGQMKTVIKDADTVILPERSRNIYSLETAYAINHNIEDLRILRKAIEDNCPEYLKEFDQVFKGHYFYGYNMMVCRKCVLDSYCEWLFPLMKTVENGIDMDQKSDSYQRRIYGFLSERLLQVWVLHNQYKIRTFEVFNTEERTDIGAVKLLKKIKSYDLKVKRIIRNDILNSQNKKYHI